LHDIGADGRKDVDGEFGFNGGVFTSDSIQLFQLLSGEPALKAGGIIQVGKTARCEYALLA
jgi:hypothetical protein